MNKFTFKNIKIKNFKGIALYEIDFNENKFEIASETGCGKSSIFEAIKWCLGFNVSNFEPRIDTFRINKIVSQVDLTIEKNNIEYILGIVSEQVFKKDKETGEEYFDSNKSTFSFNSLECKLKDYKEKITNLFEMDLDQLNILLDIEQFNTNKTGKWTWVERRKYLKDKMGIDNSLKSIIEKEEYNLLKDDLQKGKDEIDIQKQLTQEKNLYQKGDLKKGEYGLDQYQTLINNKIGEISELNKIDFDSLEKRKADVQSEIDTLIKNDLEQNQNSLLKNKEKEISNLELEIIKLRNEFYSKQSEYNSKLNELNLKITNNNNSIKNGNLYISDLETKIEENKIEISILEEEKFNNEEENLNCKYCGQKLPKDKIEELKLNFENKKKSKLEKLNKEREENDLRLVKYKECINTLISDKNALQAEYEALQKVKPILNEKKIEELNSNIQNIKNEISNIKVDEVENTVSKKVNELRIKLESIIKESGKKDSLEKCKNELAELKKKQKELSQKDVLRFKKQKQLKEFVKEEVNIINEETKKHFDKDIKFNFFTWNSVNAENEYDMCCNMLYKGVEYNNLSQGQKIICDTLFISNIQSLLDVNFPIIVDNRQDNTFDIETDSQLIELLTIKGKKLNGLTRINDVYTLDDCDIKG